MEKAGERRVGISEDSSMRNCLRAGSWARRASRWEEREEEEEGVLAPPPPPPPPDSPTPKGWDEAKYEGK